MGRRLRHTLIGISLAVLASTASGADAPSPQSVLGFRPGDDGRLATWEQVRQYFHALDAASDRVSVEQAGITTEGRPFLRVLVTSEQNMHRIEEIRRDNLRLADPRGLSDADARRVVERGRVVVGHFHGLHATEVASTLTAMELAWQLASTDDPALLEILDRVVIVMLPSQNPDGLDLVEGWNRRTAETAWRGTAPPWLYQRYTGHDNNRDWYMFTQQETRLTIAQALAPWPPQIVHDLHQMGRRGPRLFVPPYVDPWEPNVDPALVAALNDLGTWVASRLTDAGHRGIVVHALFDAWTPARAYPHSHGGVRLLSETASADIAWPTEVAPEQLESGRNYQPHQRTWNLPWPWTGGRWTLRDAVELQVAASVAALSHAARNREIWLQRFLDVNRRAVATVEPSAWIIPAGQADPVATARMVEALRWGLVEVHRARDAFTADGLEFPAGSLIVPMQQPASSFAHTVLSRQDYPDLRQDDGTPLKPYDATAHTLPLLMGVDAVAVEGSLKVPSDRLDGFTVTVPPGQVRGRGSWLAVPSGTSGMMAALRLLRAGVDVRRATGTFEAGGRRFATGTLLVPSSSRRTVESLARELGLDVRAVSRIPAATRLRLPRVGLYRSWVPALDEGWTRFVFERQLGIEYVTLHDADVRAGSLGERFDVVVLPDQDPRRTLLGHPAGTMPPEFTGGLGAEGIAALRTFVEQGGTLVTLNAASDLAIRELDLPVRNRLMAPDPQVAADRPDEGVDRIPETRPAEPVVYCPGAILLGQADTTHPLAAGLDESVPLWFETSPAFDVGEGATAVITYPTGDPLLSGWLLGGEHLAGAAALVEAPLGKGRVVLFGFRPQYRAQSWATYPALVNALLR